jgi:hypothetical protein
MTRSPRNGSRVLNLGCCSPTGTWSAPNVLDLLTRWRKYQADCPELQNTRGNTRLPSRAVDLSSGRRFETCRSDQVHTAFTTFSHAGGETCQNESTVGTFECRTNNGGTYALP